MVVDERKRLADVGVTPSQAPHPREAQGFLNHQPSHTPKLIDCRQYLSPNLRRTNRCPPCLPPPSLRPRSCPRTSARSGRNASIRCTTEQTGFTSTSWMVRWCRLLQLLRQLSSRSPSSSDDRPFRAQHDVWRARRDQDPPARREATNPNGTWHFRLSHDDC
jgi:hypothetical protein